MQPCPPPPPPSSLLPQPRALQGAPRRELNMGLEVHRSSQTSYGYITKPSHTLGLGPFRVAGPSVYLAGTQQLLIDIR